VLLTLFSIYGPSNNRLQITTGRSWARKFQSENRRYLSQWHLEAVFLV